jgi:hypothetical protein
MRKYFFLLILFALGQKVSIAQLPLPCGTNKINTIAEEAARAYAENHRDNSPLTVTRQIRVYFYIVSDNDGSNSAATPAQVEAEFADIVNDYAPNSLCFANMGYGIIYNTDINNNIFADSSLSAAALNTYLVPNCITIFFQRRLRKVGGGQWGGFAYSIPNTFCSVATGNIGVESTTTHEVGHCLGLIHTFENYGGTVYENINGSNCAGWGDKVCDTPADPFGRACASASGCTYTGSCADANGATNYTPPTNNIMAYWPINAGCTATTLTTGQFARTNSFMNTNAGLLGTQSPANNLFGPSIINSSYAFVSAINNVNTNGLVECLGNCIVGFSGRKVTLSPGFKASPSTGKVTIKVNECFY